MLLSPVRTMLRESCTTLLYRARADPVFPVKQTHMELYGYGN